MKKTMKKSSRAGIAVLCSAALIGAAVGGVLLGKARDESKFSYPQSSSAGPSSSAGGEMDTTIKADGVVLALASTAVDSSGRQVRTFSYAVTPADADQAVTAALAWTDPAVADGVGDCLSVALDLANRKIAITMLRDFAHQATLAIAAKGDAAKTASVAIDCPKRFLGFKEVGERKACYGAARVGSVPFDNSAPLLYDSLGDPLWAGSGVYSASGTVYSKGYSAVYSEDRSFAFSASLGAAPSAFGALAMESNEAGGYGVVDMSAHPDFGALRADLSGIVGGGKAFSYPSFKQAAQTAFDGLSSATKAYLKAQTAEDPATGLTGITHFSLYAPATVVLACSDGQSASYPITLNVMDPSSGYSF